MTHGAGALELWHNLSAYPEFFSSHSYSLGPMFVDCQNFASLWGSYFVGNWFIALQCKAIHNLLSFCSGHEFVCKVTHEIHKHKPPR